MAQSKIELLDLVSLRIVMSMESSKKTTERSPLLTKYLYKPADDAS